MFIIYGYQGAGIWEIIIIITLMSSHRMDKHLGLWRMHKNNTIFKSHHIVMRVISKRQVHKYVNGRCNNNISAPQINCSHSETHYIKA